MDDVFIATDPGENHHTAVFKTLDALKENGFTLSISKCEFDLPQIEALGLIVSNEGTRISPARTEAILGMTPPEDVNGVRRFLGAMQYVAKFIERFTEIVSPIQELLRNDVAFMWGEAQERAFQKIKEKVASEQCLAHYSVKKETTVMADSSKFAIGAVILQKQDNGDILPIAYASRRLTAAEQNYAQIEKEALSLTWACEKFETYILGKKIRLITDHKPLIPILSSKPLWDVPLRIQRFRLRLMRYDFEISHCPGKEFFLPDCLSRQPFSTTEEQSELEDDTLAFVQAIVTPGNLGISQLMLDRIRAAINEDEIAQKLIKTIHDGIPISRQNLHPEIKKMFSYLNELSICDGLILRGERRLYIPNDFRNECLRKLHTSHLGISKSVLLAKEVMFWPGMVTEIQTMIKACDICRINSPMNYEKMLSTDTPVHPWHTVGTDIMEFQGKPYLVVVDYFSRFVELAQISNMTSTTVINHLRSIFARYGIPSILRSDGGPCYRSKEFAAFAIKYDFKHVMSSPYFPHGNGEAERAVRTVKTMLKKTPDPYIALLSYRSTPLENGFSPSELLMGRKLRTNLPTLPKNLIPNWDYLEKFYVEDKRIKERQARDFNRRHRTRNLEDTFEYGSLVFDRISKKPAIVVDDGPGPRSLEIQDDDGDSLVRNRTHLVPIQDRPHRLCRSPAYLKDYLWRGDEGK